MAKKKKQMTQEDFGKGFLGLHLDMRRSMNDMTDEERALFVDIISTPGLAVSVNRTTTPYGMNIGTRYGVIQLDHTLKRITDVYINDVPFLVNDTSLEGLRKLTGSLDDLDEIIVSPKGRTRPSRGRRQRHRNTSNLSFEEARELAYEDLRRSGIVYENLFKELGEIVNKNKVDLGFVMGELSSQRVEEDQIAYFLTHESEYANDIIAAVNRLPFDAEPIAYNFKPIKLWGEGHELINRIMDSLGVMDAEFDVENRTLKIGDRLITNIPNVDENGIFSSGETRYIPYYTAYFAAVPEDVPAELRPSRVERLRVIDPVEKAIDAVIVQMRYTTGDVKFKTLLDVSRNLPDFENHPHGDILLETYKRKVVLDKRYGQTNSLLKEFQNGSDDLGAVALTMLDKDAKGVIDPLVTSNGTNLGKIFYLTEDAQVEWDGSIIRGVEEHSPLGKLMTQFHIEYDNFNRNQMSGNAALTSTDMQEVVVVFSEFAAFNAEDAVVLTRKGADKFDAHVGDKFSDMHGNKGVVSLVADPNMSEDEAKAKQMEWANEFARLNPDVDMIASPVGIASRLNMGVIHESLASAEKIDIKLPDGSVIKDGGVKMTYMKLPQTAEHKSKDYAQGGSGRRYSNLFRFALSSKIGKDLYESAVIDPAVRNYHINKVSTAMQRLGYTMLNPEKQLEAGNVVDVSIADKTIDRSELTMLSKFAIRDRLNDLLTPRTVAVDGRESFELPEHTAVNINLGHLEVRSPLSGEIIKDAEGNNVLPILVEYGNGVPYRYLPVLDAVATGNQTELTRAFTRAASQDYTRLTRKDSIIKDINTMTFTTGARTDVIIPDPRIGLGEVRSSVPGDLVVVHRDPAIWAGNVIVAKNIGGNEPNVTHTNPLMINQVDGDYDGDQMGVNDVGNLRLSEDGRQELYNRASVEEQVNKYGEVFLATDSSHFKAMALATGTDLSNLTFEDGKSNRELVETVNSTLHSMVNDQRSYGAYALSFTDLETVKEGLFRLADDGIKGNRDDIERHLERGYTPKENVNVAKALIAKAEWTGLAGAVTNNLITVFDDENFDAELTRVAMEITHTMTQSVLQMKKSPEKLPIINRNIAALKSVMNGNVPDSEARESLLRVTDGLCSPAAVDHFIKRVHEVQESRGINPEQGMFGFGVLNGLNAGTAKLAYTSETSFNKVLNGIVNSTYEKWATEPITMDDVSTNREEPIVVDGFDLDISDLTFDDEISL